jgi:glycosyltransferase involved in cell wall biosynthesis
MSPRRPIYLLVNHLALAATANPARFRIGELWLFDLQSQAKAIADAGMKLVVATPCAAAADPLPVRGGFQSLGIVPDEHGFEYQPLPRFADLAGYRQTRVAFDEALRRAIAIADVVQMGHGGHPLPFGQLAWPIASGLGKRRVWVFDGPDPVARRLAEADRLGNPLKRFIKKRRIRAFETFLAQAVRDADAVFAHAPTIARRFAASWGPRCHTFDRADITDELLIDPDTLAERHGRLLDAARPLRLLVAGKQRYIHGTDQVLRALAKARRLSVPLELDVLGDGDDLNGFRRLAAELKVADHVRFLGPVADGDPMLAAWDRCDVVVVTNLTAEISRNLALAGARGMPLITYTNPATDPGLRGADAAVLVPRADIDRLADAFIQSHRQRSRLVTIALNGWKLARARNLDETHRRRARIVAELLGLTPPAPAPAPAH